MLSFTTASHQFLYSRHSISHLKFPVFPSFVLDINPGIRQRNREGCYFNLLMPKESCSWRFLELRRKSYTGSRCCWCKGWDTDGDPALEAEILEFMNSSPKPDVFPSKKELVDAGRTDLVDAIRTKGGWLSLGWDSDDEGIGVDKVVLDSVGDFSDFTEYKSRVAAIQQNDSSEAAEFRFSEIHSVSANSSQPASPSSRSLETWGDEDSGIEGILNRLERERNLAFGINLGENVNGTSTSSKDDEDNRQLESLADVEDREKSRRAALDSSSRIIYDNSDGKLSEFMNGTVKPDMWRAWSNQRAGFSDTEFEAAEISFGEKHLEDSRDETLLAQDLDIQQKINHWEIKTRLKQLERELSTALRLLRSKEDDFISKGDGNSSSDDVHKISDELEFQENEFINSQGQLRSTRAKIAVLEGKMALAIIEAQKMGEEKQKRINGARTALQLLRTATIVWPNSASQVLLVGSFDGWTSQRKMEKSRTGVFSVTMKLYPGRYEIKFIVDGEWRVDPLRPIVRNNGYENNLFIIT